MINKYYDLLDFYNENTKPEKIIKAKKELQQINETYNEMIFYYKLDFTDTLNPNYAIN